MNKRAEVPTKDAKFEEGEQVVFEIFVQPGFSDLELSAVTTVLRTANDILNNDVYSWKIISDEPGLVTSSSDLIVRAAPSIGGQYLCDCLVVICGRTSNPEAWLARLRAMQQLQRRVILLSDASRQYVRSVNNLDAPTTAHWRDVSLLQEVGSYPKLTDSLVETHGTVLTCAGHGHTLEAMIGVLEGQLDRRQCAEIASLLVLDRVRGFSSEQPKGSSYSSSYFEKRLQNALRLMEANIEQPLRLADVAKEVGLSTRHLERLFTVYFNTTPSKLYKKIRLKKAHALVVDTHLQQIEIALSCGFGSAGSFSLAYKAEYGETPTQRRKRMR